MNYYPVTGGQTEIDAYEPIVLEYHEYSSIIYEDQGQPTVF